MPKTVSANEIECPLLTTCCFSRLCTAKRDSVSGPMTFKKGELISCDFDQDEAVYIVKNGIGIATYCLDTGEVVTLFLLGKGQTFGELYPFIVNRTPVSFHALTKMSVCRLSGPILLQLVRRDPTMLYSFIQASEGNYHTFCRQLWIMNGQRVYDRIKRALLVLNDLQGRNCDKVPLTLTHDELALIINTDRPSVTRALKKLRDEDLVDVGYQRIWVKNPFQLELLFRSNPHESDIFLPLFDNTKTKDNFRQVYTIWSAENR